MHFLFILLGLAASPIAAVPFEPESTQCNKNFNDGYNVTYNGCIFTEFCNRQILEPDSYQTITCTYWTGRVGATRDRPVVPSSPFYCCKPKLTLYLY